MIKKNLLTIGLFAAVIGVLAVTAVAVTQTAYSVDKSNYRFTSDIKTQYTSDEAKDIQISLIDTTTGQKPAGVSVTMKVDNQATRTVLTSASQTSTRFVNMGNLTEGPHTVMFTLPEACGNFFDFSTFGAQTKFDNEYDCQFVRQFTVGAVPDVLTDVDCTDPAALNFNPRATSDDGSCTYVTFGCTNPVALNYNAQASNNDGSCTFDPAIQDGCTDPSAKNYVAPAQNDDGSCEYYVYGCTDARALNYNSAAEASDGTCQYDGSVTPSAFECSINNRLWTSCEGRTFTLRTPDVPIYVRTESQSAGLWSDWCTGDLNNGVQATFNELSSNGANAEVNFAFANPGTLFDMTLCLSPDSPTKADAFQRIKLKLLNTKFIEN